MGTSANEDWGFCLGMVGFSNLGPPREEKKKNDQYINDYSLVFTD